MSVFSFAGRLFARSVISFACTIVAFAAAAACANASQLAAVPIVVTSSGAVSGTLVPTISPDGALMQAYLGIPYAAPPVGPLRWRPPQPHAAWNGVRAAVAFGNHCPQSASFSGRPSLAEDCLYLNVYAPAGTKPNAKLPAMVWLHGGAFVTGESNDYDPDRLVARGVIVVTLNYRLGYLGFLATPGLDAEHHTHNNFGLLDQQFALAWTRANIAKFGGDPRRTTVFGQSAGGASVFAQLLSPGSAGLFAGAIIQSGAYDIFSLPSLTAAEATGTAVAAAAGCTHPLDTTCLRRLSVAKILALQAGVPLGAGPSPAVDGAMIPFPPEAALAFGRYNHVPIVQGTNHDEFRYFTALEFDLQGHPITAASYPAVVQSTLAGVGLAPFTPLVLAQYPLANYATPDQAYSALTTDAIFSTPAYDADVLLAAGTQVYAYEFSDENAPEIFLPAIPGYVYGAAHASELPYLYDFYALPSSALSAPQARLAATMVDDWTRFAATGDPHAPDAPFWAPYFPLLDNMIALVPPRPAYFNGGFHVEHKTPFWTYLALQAQAADRGSAAKHYLTLAAVKAAARAYGATLRP